MLALRFFPARVCKTEIPKNEELDSCRDWILSVPGAALAGAPEGVWMSEDGGTKVRISTCQANKLCGTVAWLARPIDLETGKPKTDKLIPIRPNAYVH
jgi:hypothetical protein